MYFLTNWMLVLAADVTHTLRKVLYVDKRVNCSLSNSPPSKKFAKTSLVFPIDKYSHLSKGPRSDLKQNGTKENELFSDPVFCALHIM